MEEKNNPRTRINSVRGRQNKKEEECPFCKVSEDTIERLKKAEKNKKTKDKPVKNDKRPQNREQRTE